MKQKSIYEISLEESQVLTFSVTYTENELVNIKRKGYTKMKVILE